MSDSKNNKKCVWLLKNWPFTAELYCHVKVETQYFHRHSYRSEFSSTVRVLSITSLKLRKISNVSEQLLHDPSINMKLFSLLFTSLIFGLAVSWVLLQALFLCDDNILDVLHGEMVSEGVEQDVFELLQGHLLHVKLQGGNTRGLSSNLSTAGLSMLLCGAALKS